VGGTISGYSLMGSDGHRQQARHRDQDRQHRGEDRPLDEERRDIHRAPLLTRRAPAWPASAGQRIAAHVHPLRRHGDSRMHALRAVHDDDIARLQTLAHDAQAIDHPAQLTLRYSILLSAPSTSTYFWL
jgi:hypothetical protein